MPEDLKTQGTPDTTETETKVPAGLLNDDTVDDDPTEPDPANETAATDPTTEPAAEEQPAEASTEAPEAAKDETPAKEAPAEKLLTQADVDRIVAQRLTRERQASERRVSEQLRTYQELEAKLGAPLSTLVDQQRANKVQELMTTHAMSEEEATAFAAQEEQLNLYKAREAQREEEARNIAAERAYEVARNAYMNDPSTPAAYKTVVEKYGHEVDEFSQSGRKVDFKVAATYIAGQHLPEILAAQQAEAAKKVQAKEQATVANIQKRAKVQPTAPTTGVPQSEPLSGEEKQMAKKLGISETAYAKQKAAMNR